MRSYLSSLSLHRVFGRTSREDMNKRGQNGDDRRVRYQQGVYGRHPDLSSSSYPLGSPPGVPTFSFDPLAMKKHISCCSKRPLCGTIHPSSCLRQAIRPNLIDLLPICSSADQYKAWTSKRACHGIDVDLDLNVIKTFCNFLIGRLAKKPKMSRPIKP